MNVEQFQALIAPVTEAIADLPVDAGLADELNRRFPADGEAFKAITDAGQAIWDRTNQYDDDHQRELDARKKAEEAGVTWLDDFPAEDRKLFLEAVSETWRMMAEEAGGAAPDYRQRILTALGR